MIVNLNITKTGILRGKRSHAHLCPVARAFKARGFRGVSVTHGWWSGEKNGHVYAGKLPVKLTKLIESFDGRRPIKPCKARVYVQS